MNELMMHGNQTAFPRIAPSKCHRQTLLESFVMDAICKMELNCGTSLLHQKQYVAKRKALYEHFSSVNDRHFDITPNKELVETDRGSL